MERENRKNELRDVREEKRDLETNLAARHQALERILRDIEQIIGDEAGRATGGTGSDIGKGRGDDDVGDAAGTTPLERAQDLIYKAWETSGLERADFAVKALQLCEDCADAYVILAEETSKTPAEAIQMYELAVRAGERALGHEIFRENAGEFWDIVEAHPYMRARTKLAEALWKNGDHRRAIIHYKELLRLDSGDSQGIRYCLMNCLLEEGLHQEVKELIVEYRGDQTAAWLYSRALWGYVRFGAGIRSGAYLKEAFEANLFAPDYILSRKELPAALPDYYGWGDDNEAVVYAHHAIATWQKIDGALEWLEESYRSRTSGRTRSG